MTVRLTWIFEPPPFPDPYGLRTPRKPDSYQPFFDEIGRQAAAAVERVEAFLDDVPPRDGFLLLQPSRDPGKRAITPGRWIVPIYKIWPEALYDRMIEDLAFPCGVDSMVMEAWLRGDRAARGLYGRSDVAQTIGADCAPSVSEQYGHLTSARHDGLPHLLVDYLRAFVKKDAKKKGSSISAEPFV
jgi:hypothetical protein